MVQPTSGIFKSICSVNMRWFPFDVQKCELKFGSWTYDGHMVDLKMGTIDTTLYTDNGEWHLVGKKHHRKKIQLSLEALTPKYSVIFVWLHRCEREEKCNCLWVLSRTLCWCHFHSGDATTDLFLCLLFSPALYPDLHHGRHGLSPASWLWGEDHTG